MYNQSIFTPDNINFGKLLEGKRNTQENKTTNNMNLKIGDLHQGNPEKVSQDPDYLDTQIDSNF